MRDWKNKKLSEDELEAKRVRKNFSQVHYDVQKII